MTMKTKHSEHVSRREMLTRTSAGLGGLVLAAAAADAMAAQEGQANPLAPRASHFTPRAKRVILLWQQGGPPHQDTFDPKPLLNTKHGTESREFASILGDRFKRSTRKLMGSPWKFQKHGQSGLEISDAYPKLAELADELCLIRGMHGDFPGHGEAALQMHTGQGIFTRPALGAWTVYGLGTENANLPGFVALGTGRSQWAQSAFLPAVYTGTPVSVSSSSKTGTIRYLQNRSLTRKMQREQIDLIQKMNHDLVERTGQDAKIAGMIDNYELAFRMQGVAPEVLNFTDESEQTIKAYGIDNADRALGTIGAKCLVARRLVEAGVRFVEVGCQGSDPHSNLKKGFGDAARRNDQPIAALIADLKQRGLLKDTLIVCSGEFGRTHDTNDKKMDGRDHNNRGFTTWLAGGGVKGGMAYGATDELGAAAVQDKVHVHDLHATILHLLGLDHERLTFRWSGRDFRLTNVYGNVVHDILA
jgi:hypothetical protein